MKVKKDTLNAAKNKLKNAGLITAFGLVGFVAPKDASAQDNTATQYDTIVKMGPNGGFKHTKLNFLEIDNRTFNLSLPISTYTDDAKNDMLARTDTLINGYKIKSYYFGKNRALFKSGTYTTPDNHIIESADNKVLMENIADINILLDIDGNISGYRICGGQKKDPNDTYLRFYDKNLKVLYDFKTQEGDHRRAEMLEFFDSEYKKILNSMPKNTAIFEIEQNLLKNKQK